MPSMLASPTGSDAAPGVRFQPVQCRRGTDAIAGDEHGTESLAIEGIRSKKVEGLFTAPRLRWASLNTQGGAKRNGASQVLDLNGQPIPRLFSAGEFGSIYAYMYNGGGNISEAVSSGRIAGPEARSCPRAVGCRLGPKRNIHRRAPVIHPGPDRSPPLSGPL